MKDSANELKPTQTEQTEQAENETQNIWLTQDEKGQEKTETQNIWMEQLNE